MKKMHNKYFRFSDYRLRQSGGRYENVNLTVFIFLVVLFGLISRPAFSQEKWDFYSLNGDGNLDKKFSTYYSKSYFINNIPPLNGEMEWDAKDKPELDVKITSLGNIKNVEYYDIIQEYKNQRQIKIIAFSNKSNQLCPFYVWQPNSGYVDNLNSKIISVQEHKIVGHKLAVYRGTYEEFFIITDGLPTRLKFKKVVGDYIIKNYPGQYVRSSGFDIENLVDSVKLANKTDASCCPTGNSIDIYFTLVDGQLEIINVEEID